MNKIFAVFVLIFVLGFNPLLAFSESQNNVSVQDMMLLMNNYPSLPDYCKVRLAEREIITVRNENLPRKFIKIRDNYFKKIGENWYCLHHYCWGIKKYQDAISLDYNDPFRNKKLKNALSEFKFQERCTKKYGFFPLYRNMLIYQYRIYSKIGDNVNAQKTFKKLNNTKK